MIVSENTEFLEVHPRLSRRMLSGS